MISVLILTKNEQQDLPDCLKSINWCDDIHVFDSYSTDATVEIAKDAGALVTQRIFDGYALQRNAALSSLKFKYEWIFILDADERIPNALAEEITLKLAKSSPNVNGYRIRRKDFLFDRWLKYSQISSYYVRLIRRGKARYHREINEVIEVDGEVVTLKSYFDHYPFSKGFSHWLEKHNQYSTMEAYRWIEEHENNMKFSLNKALFSKDFSERRYHQKGLFYKLPARPLVKWVYMVFFRRAFLDGRAGLTYATLQSVYEYFIVLKTNQLIKEHDR